MTKRRILIRDLTLRDGQQSLFATRMTQEQIDELLPLFKEAGFYAMEVWGGAVPDSIMRYLKEDPWERLEKISKAIGNSSKLTALSRGRNLFGYNPYPDEVIEGFLRNAVESGIRIMRVFDALNDTNNIESSIRFLKKYGATIDAALCYTVDPKFSTRARVKAFLHGKSLPNRIFTDDYFVNLARELEAMGADMLTIKAMAGLITPMRTYRLISRLKSELSIPIDFHTHCTPGYGLASSLMSLLANIDILDTSILNFAGGPGAPAFEIIQIFCNKLNIETDLNLKVIGNINEKLGEIRKSLSTYDTAPYLPRPFHIATDDIPLEIHNLFDKAIAAAQNKNQDELLESCHAIEDYFQLPPPDEKIREAEIPGGMYTNMLSQLKQVRLENLLPRTLELIPEVRLDAGLPPLVTPTSQIIGSQAVNCALDETKGQPMYTNRSLQFVNLVKGIYGKTPYPIDPEFRYKIAGVREETPYDFRFYKKQPNPVFEEYGGIKLANNEKEELLLELFPNVAADFLKNRVEQIYMAKIHQIEEEKHRKLEEEKAAYEKLTPEEKRQRLLNGLYNYKWTSYQDDEEEALGHS
ncbi:MAG: carboxylase [Bacteroidales bacterium]|nr:carboxylase [Bacteroidales bacterium]